MSIADRIIKKCGGVQRTAELSGKSVNWVYRWKLGTDKGGTGGRIPFKAQQSLLEAANKGLVDIEPADFFSAPQGPESTQTGGVQ